MNSSRITVYIYRFIKIAVCRFVFSTGLYELLYKHKISEVLDSSKKYKLVVCHNGGGGTAGYLNNKYGEMSDILLLRKEITADKDYLYSLRNLCTKKTVYINPKQLNFLRSNINEVNVVSVDSFMSLNKLFNFFASLCVPITYDLHDYHCIWYESHLIRNGKYLTKDILNSSKFKYMNATVTFDQYHRMWEFFFNNVYKINVFSKSSKKIFGNFFPNYLEKVNLIPHSLNYIKCGKLKAIPEKFTIGIFGSILGEDKGCKVVQSFLNYSKGKNYEVFFNGELSSDCMVMASNIHYKGRYDVSKLDEIIKSQKISVVFFPSICPETFSYTIAELIYVGIPIACFNIGAQEEKVSAYQFGEIINQCSNEAIYDALLTAYKKGQQRIKKY